jgi:branched-chain amino acid transport system substrate-binding protein
MAALACVWLATGACRPQKLDLARVDTARPADKKAESDWKAARSAFELNIVTSAPVFEGFISAHPQDPLVPAAYLFLARARLAGQEFDAAQTAAQNAIAAPGASKEITRSARYLSALAAVGRGAGKEALPVLAEFKDGFSDPAENARTALALGEAAASAGESRRALAAFSEAHARSESAPDRLFAARRAQDLAPLLSPEEARSLYDQASKDSLAAAVLAPRLARDLSATGKPGDAADILGETRSARLALFGTDLVEGSGKGVDARAIGAVLPLTGKTSRIGRLFLRGLFFAADGAARPNEEARFRLVVRDSQSTPEGARAAVEELAKIEGVIAIVGPSDPEEAKAAAKASQALGVPMLSLSLSPEVTAQGEFVFWSSVDNDLEARSLARAAVSGQKATRLAILYPETLYGSSMQAAFADEARKLGATIAATQAYPEGASSWDKQLKAIAKEKPQAIFIADGAKTFAALAPALAVAGLWSAAPGQKPPKGKPVQLLGPSPAIAPRLLAEGGNTVEGALFATEFFPDDPRTAEFSKDFARREKEQPTFFDAASYEAFSFLSSGVEGGATSRRSLRDSLASGEFSSLSGKTSFPGERRANRTLTLVRVVNGKFEVKK